MFDRIIFILLILVYWNVRVYMCVMTTISSWQKTKRGKILVMKLLCNNIDWYRRRLVLSPMFILPRALFAAPGVNARKALWRAVIDSLWEAEWSCGCQEVIKVTRYSDFFLMTASRSRVGRNCKVRMRIFDAACSKKMLHLLW